MKLVSVGDLITKIKRRYDGEGTDHTDLDELLADLSEYYSELYMIAVEKGVRYFQTSITFAATGATGYALPADHLKTMDVYRVVNANTGEVRRLLGPIEEEDRALLIGQLGDAYRYGYGGQNLELFPVPASGSYIHVYIPQPPDLATAATSDTVDMFNVYGERLVTWGVASVQQHKESTSQQRALMEYQRAQERLEYWVTQRGELSTEDVRYDAPNDLVPQRSF